MRIGSHASVRDKTRGHRSPAVPSAAWVDESRLVIFASCFHIFLCLCYIFTQLTAIFSSTTIQ